MHSQVRVLLLSDPLERDPPQARLPFHSGGHRLELDLASARQRQAWRRAFALPLAAARQQLPAPGVHVDVLSSEGTSEAWLSLRERGAWARRGGGDTSATGREG